MKLIRVDRTPLTEEMFASLEQSGHVVNGTEQWFMVRDNEKDILLFALQNVMVIGPFVKNNIAKEDGKPLVSNHEVAVGLKEASIVARVLAQNMAIGNVLVFSQDETIQKFAQSVGMQQMPETAFIQSTIP